jgi:hypothetical protein
VVGTQFALEDLTGGVVWDLVDEHDRLRDLEAGQVSNSGT